MSHRVTVQTEIKNKALAVAAMKKLGWTHVDEGSRLKVTGGPAFTTYVSTYVDLQTGAVEGDTMRSHELNRIKQAYSLETAIHNIKRRGDLINKQENRAGGVVRLYCTQL
jgi:hypothetical protein